MKLGKSCCNPPFSFSPSHERTHVSWCARSIACLSGLARDCAKKKIKIKIGWNNLADVKKKNKSTSSWNSKIENFRVQKFKSRFLQELRETFLGVRRVNSSEKLSSLYFILFYFLLLSLIPACQPFQVWESPPSVGDMGQSRPHSRDASTGCISYYTQDQCQSFPTVYPLFFLFLFFCSSIPCDS